MKKILFLSIFACTASHVLSQTQAPSVLPTPYTERVKAIEQRKKLEENSLLGSIKFRNVGPTIMSGRVVDIEVSPLDPTHFYVAYASGGLWKTQNNGLTFKPIFDNEESMTIGDFAVDWKNHETIWIGTGENNSSRSSYPGTGMFKSNDGGKTWIHKGLEETQHIGKVIISPTDSNTIWVAAIGHLFSGNKERGIFKTKDGGKTWKQVLFKDEFTGAIDMCMDPSNPDILYATLWHRERQAWDFIESGNTSGIYKSTDAGESWACISSKENGFPISSGTGRIGLAIFPGNTSIIYAVVDNQDHRPKENKKDEKKLKKEDFKTISNDDFLKLDDKLLNTFLEENDFPEKYTASIIKEKIKKGTLKPIQLSEFLEDENAQLFDTPVIGPEVYRSDDAGKSWKKQNSKFIDQLFFTYGYYFGRIWVSPTNENKIYVSGLFPLKSDDGGKTFKRMYNGNLHADHHALWINPQREGHLINGNDGGINISYDDGKTWYKANTPAVGQFYSVNFDMESPYNVYGGLQDNGVWFGSSKTNPDDISWHQEGQNAYKSILGGDGMQVQVDTRDNNTIYTGYQFGNYYRINKTNGELKYISPKHDLGEHPFRWNWQAPILISKHNQDIVYMGSNHFHRSMNKGEDFKTFSDDLTKGGKKGDVPYGTLTCIDESPLRFGLIYAGSDDGLLHVSKDAGNTWTKISGTFPKDLWVRKVTASLSDEATVYVCLNGHTFDHFKSYLFVSHDYGNTWKSIGTDLPVEPVNVVKEDPMNPNLLFVGTDHGVYASLNKGESFMRMTKNFPAVAVHDLAVHPRDHDLIVGTHGRSIYIANIKELEELQDTILQKDLYVYDISDITYRSSWGKKGSEWDEPQKPEFIIPLFIRDAAIIKTEVMGDSSLLLQTFNDTLKKGLNYISYDLSIDSNKKEQYQSLLNTKKKKDEEEIKLEKKDSGKYYLQAGKYTCIISNLKTGNKIKKEIVITKPKEKIRVLPLNESEKD